MANYDLTYEGSRVQGILDTGDELRDAGYIFRGEATPSTVPGTPTERVAYIGGPGTYTNFGGSTVVPSGSIGVFKYTGSAWSNQVIACTVPISTSVQNNDTTVPTGKAVKAAVDAEAQARQLADSTLQGGINTVSAAVTAINNAIGNGSVYAGIATPSSTPASGKVFYLAFTAGTYTNFNSLEVPQGINILKNNGSTWLLDSFLGIDDAPTQGSANLVKSGGVLGSIIQNGPAFDLSAYNAVGGTLATYADLSAALTVLNALPAAYKKGGMSVKFVLSSDNSYVIFFCTANEFTTDISAWQGVDGNVTNGSKNLIESNAVYVAVKGVDEKITDNQLDVIGTVNLGGYFELGNYDGTEGSDEIIEAASTKRIRCNIYLKTGDVISMSSYTETDMKILYFDENDEVSIRGFGQDFTAVLDTRYYILARYSDGRVITDVETLASLVTVYRSNNIDERLTDVEDAIRLKELLQLHGDNNNLVTGYINVKEGDSLSLYPSSTSWNCSNVTSQYVFVVYTIDSNGQNVRSFSDYRRSQTNHVMDSLLSKMDFVIQQNEVRLKITMRADSGQEIDFLSKWWNRNEIDVLKEEINSTSIIALHPDKYMLPILENYKKKWSTKDTGRNDKLVLMHFSDLHAELKTIKRLDEFYKYYGTYISDALLSGDIVDVATDTFSWWSDYKNILTCIGNHEILVSGDDIPEVGGVKLKSPYFYSKKWCYNKYFKDFVSQTGITIQENQSYWYKDYASCKIRFIALDYMHWREIPKLVDNTELSVYPDGGSPDNGEQATWLQGLLDDVLDSTKTCYGYSVLITLHAPLQYGNHFSCSFDSLHPYGLIFNNSELPLMIDTFKNAGGEFICYLCGHNHVDMIGTVYNYSNQISVCIDSCKHWGSSGEIVKIDNTNSADLFNLVCIDNNLKTVSLMRIGSNFDREGRHIGSLVFKYDTGEIIWNT